MITYHINYTEPQRQYIAISVHFACSTEREIQLQFPAWRPGRYQLAHFAQFVKNFSVTDENGKRLPFHKCSKDQWIVSCENARELKVSYKFFANILNAGSTFMDDRQLYVNPVNCCIYILDRQEEPCEVHLNIPDNYEVASAVPFKDRVARYQNYHELVDTPFVASAELKVASYEVLGKTFYLWFMGDFEPHWERIIHDFERFTHTQIAKFSDRRKKYVGFPVDEYHFIFQILNTKAYHGVEHEKSTVISLGPNTEIMDKLYDEFLGVSSHELYHTWNVKCIRPKDMLPYDYSKENYTKMGYVAEGVTTYLGDVFLAESGVKDFKWYQSELEKLLQKHFDNFGRFNYSVAASSWDTWLDGYQKGAPDRKVSIYNEGALLAFALDMKIRKASENKQSLHDVMNDLYQEFGLKNRGYTEADYQQIAEKYTQDSLDTFFTDYINGTKPFESLMVEALETIGYTLEMKDNPKLEEQRLGIKLDATPESLTIMGTYPGGSGDLAGLMKDDILIAVNGEDVNQKNLQDVLEKHQDNSLTLNIDRMGRHLILICPHTNRKMFPVYFIQKSEITANLHKRIFKNWIGKKWEDE